MRPHRIGSTLVKIASVYLVIGLAGGMYMAVSGQFGFVSAHSHVTLLGWATMALTGLVYVAFPRCAESRLSRAHFWLHNLGLPVMTVSLTAHAAGTASAEPFVALGSMVVIVALLLFTVNVLRNAAPVER